MMKQKIVHGKPAINNDHDWGWKKDTTPAIYGYRSIASKWLPIHSGLFFLFVGLSVFWMAVWNWILCKIHHNSPNMFDDLYSKPPKR